MGPGLLSKRLGCLGLIQKNLTEVSVARGSSYLLEDRNPKNMTYGYGQLGQKENPNRGPQVDGSIFPFTNLGFLG